ncbi:MAG: hypothetical protein WAQ98_32265 [Blastocatellia bacterium]
MRHRNRPGSSAFYSREVHKAVFAANQEHLRWSKFKHLSAQEMYNIFSNNTDGIFPFIKELKSDREDSTYAHHMKDARFTIATAGLLAKVVDMIDKLPMEDRDTKSDLYEHMLGKIANTGQT